VVGYRQTVGHGFDPHRPSNSDVAQLVEQPLPKGISDYAICSYKVFAGSPLPLFSQPLIEKDGGYFLSCINIQGPRDIK
jgi:hypothetical protein